MRAPAEEMVVVTDDGTCGRSHTVIHEQNALFRMTYVIPRFASLEQTVREICAVTFATAKACMLQLRNCHSFIGARLIPSVSKPIAWGYEGVCKTSPQ